MTDIAAPLATAEPAADPQAPAIAVRDLVKRYPGDVGVLGIELEIGRRQVCGLVGPNGAGKTTLLSLLCGLTTPDAGTIEVEGRYALCPDAPAFEPWLTGTEVLRQSFALARGKARLERAWLDEVVEATGIGGYRRRWCGGWSRGMTQRLGIAAALIVDPEVLVLDEPTSALDTAGRAEVLALIRRLGGQRTVVLSSHTLADVQRVADTIVVMDAGKVLFTGPPQELIDAHLRPAWRVVLAADAAPVAQALTAWAEVRAVRVRGDRELDVEFATVAAGQKNLVRILADAGAPVLSLAPIDADLESAFLTLTEQPRKEDER